MKNGGYLKRKVPMRKSSGKARIKSIKCWHDGIMFDSIWEGDCYLELKKRIWAKEITQLQTHRPMPLMVTNHLGDTRQIEAINVDFFFYDIKKQCLVCADAKPPEKLDAEKAEWFYKWKLLQFLNPEYHYELYRMHAADSWRAYKPDREKA